MGDEYKHIIASYVEKGYIWKVKESEGQPHDVWYLPHFLVCRSERLTTKTRIVFDASAKFHGTSLNDEIYPEPKLQNSFFDVLLRFRSFPVAVACDVSEMYLQIRIPPEDRPKFRFLWRNLEVNRKPDVYEFERVVFGDASAPFRAQYVSQENARIHHEEFPLAADTVSKSTYMDDSLDSVRDNDSAIQLVQELQELWAKAGMKARKWLSNSAEVVAAIPKELRAYQIDLNDSLPATKTLGVLWRAQQDVLTFQVKKPTEEDKLTKRTILSKVAGVFDRLGLASPFTIRAKILLQDMWTKGLSWDEPIDRELSIRARDWLSELENLQEINVPRCLQEVKLEKTISVQTFVGASNEAYGAVSYLRSEYAQGCYDARIITSKTRVGPLTPMSTPRSQLMAAILGLHLTLSILAAFNIPISQARFWSDSMNVLYWIRGKGKQYRPFVANRIGEIQRQSNPEQWHYVESKENPADLCSRGLRATRLNESTLWWRDPDFLSKLESEWPKVKIAEGLEVKTESKTKFISAPSVNFVARPLSEDCKWRLHPSNWSSWLKLTRVVAWVLRFVANCRSHRQERRKGSLSPEELQNAEIRIIRDAQQEEFSEEYRALHENKPIPKKSCLIKLTPKID